MKTYKRKVLKAPFPYFGGKSKVAPVIWKALGNVNHYIEPFFGSGAVLLSRPNWNIRHVETVNDADGHLANVWRSLQLSPEETAKWCDWPVNHVDLMARRKTLIRNEKNLLNNLVNDDVWHDPKMAGYWIWAVSCWIGKNIFSKGSTKQLPYLTHRGNGINIIDNIQELFNELSNRLRNVRVICGDWSRVCGGNWQDNMGICGVYFDPPYGASTKRYNNIYNKDSLVVSNDVREWCIKRGDKITHRIVLSGYYEEHIELLKYGWSVKKWLGPVGYSTQNKSKINKNRFKEALFFSPHCLDV